MKALAKAVLGHGTDALMSAACPIHVHQWGMPCNQVKSRMETADHWITYAEVTNGDVTDVDAKTAVHRRKVANYY